MPVKVELKVTRLFFDRKEVIDAVGRARAAALSKAGAFVRTAARSSIRKRKRASAPGQPPSSHVGLLKNFIFFSFDPIPKSVVVGPEKLNQRAFIGQNLIVGTVPHVLEFGGTEGIREKRLSRGKWTAMGHRRPRPGQKTRVRRARYRARPFMNPALEREAPKFADLWANSVKP